MLVASIPIHTTILITTTIITTDTISFLRDPFTPALHDVVEAAMQDVDETLARLGREQLPSHFYSYHHHHHAHHLHYHKNSTSTTTAGTQRDSMKTKSQKSISGVIVSPNMSMNGAANGVKRKKELMGRETKGESQPLVLQLRPWMKRQWVRRETWIKCSFCCGMCMYGLSSVEFASVSTSAIPIRLKQTRPRALPSWVIWWKYTSFRNGLISINIVRPS